MIGVPAFDSRSFTNEEIRGAVKVALAAFALAIGLAFAVSMCGCTFQLRRPLDTKPRPPAPKYVAHVKDACVQNGAFAPCWREVKGLKPPRDRGDCRIEGGDLLCRDMGGLLDNVRTIRFRVVK